MRRFRVLWAISISLLLCLVLPLRAQDFGTMAAHFKFVKLVVEWRVNADATSTQESYIEMEALSEAGAQGIGKYPLSSNKSLQHFQILQAFTLKADGQKLPVSKENILIQDGVAAAGTAASWPQNQIHQITFPNVQKGDRTIVHARWVTHTPNLPNWANFYAHLTPSNTYEKASYRIDAPQSLNLKVFASGFAVKQSQSAQNSVWEIEGSNQAKPIDANSANLLVTYPRVYASNFIDNTQLVEAYAKLSNAKAIVTDEVKTLATKITEGKTSTFDKAVAIHDWVRKNIRYVAVYLGTGGWVPHDIDWILKNRYGDCKDHALLLQTMLKAVGIEAVPVLINTTNEYVLAELPIGFNHCIVFIPSLKLFADPTDSRMPLGALPPNDADKPVAVALNEGAQLMRTPAFTADSNRITVKSKWTVEKTGKASGSVEINAKGWAATVLQDRVAQIPTAMGTVAVTRILESSRMRGRGFTQYSKVQRDTQTQDLKLVDLEIDNFISDPQAGAINPHPRLNLPVYVLNQLSNYSPEKRNYAMPCMPISAYESFEVTYDPAFKLSNLPVNYKEIHPDGVSFEAQYTLEGNTIKGWRELKISHPSHVCSTADYASRRSLMNKITQHLNRHMLFQQGQ